MRAQISCDTGLFVGVGHMRESRFGLSDQSKCLNDLENGVGHFGSIILGNGLMRERVAGSVSNARRSAVQIPLGHDRLGWRIYRATGSFLET
jgi:hypothetical protein